MVFIELPLFQKYLAFTDDELRSIQSAIMERPNIGSVIPGGKGLRKMRFALPGRGKSGGARVIYYWQTSKSLCLLVFAYPKNIMDDLSNEQLKILAKLAQEELTA
ncbi:MAG: type II toxin-antitoxin system RelE/ParE family toxin [Proteobacteria bacterium]|nr:type II toxin-antitoxin system RelE/ParE family toxin [Pseudomonadota bacterium]